MNTIPDPNSWMDVFTILVATGMIAIPSWLSVRNGRSIKKVQDQVANGHTTPLREDLDKMRDNLRDMRSDIRDDMTMIKSELTDIRSEIRYEHSERMRLDSKFEDFRQTAGKEGNVA